jgi:hypothetical protein
VVCYISCKHGSRLPLGSLTPVHRSATAPTRPRGRNEGLDKKDKPMRKPDPKVGLNRVGEPRKAAPKEARQSKIRVPPATQARRERPKHGGLALPHQKAPSESISRRTPQKSLARALPKRAGGPRPGGWYGPSNKSYASPTGMEVGGPTWKAWDGDARCEVQTTRGEGVKVGGGGA